MQSYVYRAIKNAQQRDKLNSYNDCLIKAKELWHAQYRLSKYAAHNTPYQTKAIFKKAHALFSSDWVAQHMLLEQDDLLHLYDKCFATKSSFNKTVMGYIDNLKKNSQQINRYVAAEEAKLQRRNIVRNEFIRKGICGHMPYNLYVAHEASSNADSNAKDRDGWTRVVKKRPITKRRFIFPTLTSFLYFCTYLKHQWAHLESVPKAMRFIPLRELSLYQYEWIGMWQMLRLLPNI